MDIFREATLCMTAVTAAACIGVGVAGAQPVSGVHYVALGSSYGAGAGIDPIVDQVCQRSGHNYAHQVADALDLSLVDVTCSGATTADIVDSPQTIFGTTVPPQIGAVTAETDLVTISIGGNDLGYVGGMISHSCGLGLAGGVPIATQLADMACSALPGGGGEPTPADFERVTQSLTAVVSAVQQRAPHAKVVLVHYIPVFDSIATTCDRAPLAPADAAASRRTFDGLLASTREAATQTGAATLSVPDAESHTVCSADPWVSGFGNPLATGSSGDGPASILGTIGNSYHPNEAGTNAVAAQLAQMIGQW